MCSCAFNLLLQIPINVCLFLCACVLTRCENYTTKKQKQKHKQKPHTHTRFLITNCEIVR